MSVFRKIVMFSVFLLPVLAVIAGCGKDARLEEHSGTYVLERGQAEFREIRTLTLRGDGGYSYRKISAHTGDVLEAGSGEWMIVMDRMRPGGRAIILDPMPTNIVRFEVRDDGSLLETASDAVYKKQ